jgi:cysteinyl-tRNA synthetase
MSDDFNTPEAFAILQTLARELNTAKAEGRTSEARALAGQLKGLGNILGILRNDPEDWLKGRGRSFTITPEPGQVSIQGSEVHMLLSSSDEDIEKLIERRDVARRAKDFKESDRIRDLLAAAGIVLEDGAKGTTWRRK